MIFFLFLFFQLGGIPVELTKLRNLKMLWLFSNQLTGNIFKSKHPQPLLLRTAIKFQKANDFVKTAIKNFLKNFADSKIFFLVSSHTEYFFISIFFSFKLIKFIFSLFPSFYLFSSKIVGTTEVSESMEILGEFLHKKLFLVVGKQWKNIIEVVNFSI